MLRDAHLPEPVGAELRGQELPHRDGDVLGRRDPAAEERVGGEVRVIEAVHDGLADDPLQLGEVHHHAGLRVDRPADRHVERVVVPVRDRQLAERPLVFGGRPGVHPVAVAGREAETPRAVRDPVHRLASPAALARTATLTAAPPGTGAPPAPERTPPRRARPRPPSPRPSEGPPRRAAPGPPPAMRPWTPGIRSGRITAACRRSPRRFGGYMRAPERTVGRALRDPPAAANRRRHSARSIGSGTTATLSRGIAYACAATDAQERLRPTTRSARPGCGP